MAVTDIKQIFGEIPGTNGGRVIGGGGGARGEYFRSGGGGAATKVEAEYQKQVLKDLESKAGKCLSPFDVKLDAKEAVHQKAFIQWCAVAAEFGVQVANDPRAYTEKGYAKASSLSYLVSEKEQLLFWVYSNNLNQSNGQAGNIARSMGAKAGLSDLGLDVKASFGWQGDMDNYGGLRMEMKRNGEQKKPHGGLRTDQVLWQMHYIKQGYRYEICYSWKEARDCVCRYLGIGL